MKRLLALFLAVLILHACDDAGPLALEEASLSRARAGSPALGVLTWNIYVGAQLEELVAVGDVTEIPGKVAEIYADVLATDFPSRAVAIADQIESALPHVIGLNEVSLFEFAFGSMEDLDFLGILLDELESRGLNYVVPEDEVAMTKAVATNFNIQLPIATAAGLDFLTLTDFDVILLRDDIAETAANPVSGNFAAPLPIPLPVGTIYKPSGWASVDVTLKDLVYRVFTTHLEPADTGPCEIDEELAAFVHDPQATELLAIAAQSPYPVVVTGDLNSDATGCTTDTYERAIEAGYVDAWAIGRPRGLGYTSNQAADLLNETSELFHRIDFILYRDAFTIEKGKFQGSVLAELVGEDPADKTTTGLWPSDHAGVMAEMRIAPGLGHPQ